MRGDGDPSAQRSSQRRCDPNLPRPAPALPFEVRYQETAWETLRTVAEGGVTSWHNSDLGPWCGDFLQQRELPLPWGAELCRSLWDRLLLPIRPIWVWTCPAAGQICVFLEKHGSVHTTESWWYTGKVDDVVFCMFPRSLIACRPRAGTVTEPCP